MVESVTGNWFTCVNFTSEYDASTHINCSQNLDKNSNLSSSDNSQKTATEPILGTLLSGFALITIIGNALVIYAVARERHLRSVTNYFLVSLAVADLIIGAVVMPFAISLVVSKDFWHYGVDWCDVWHSFDVLASTASILNLCVIALDRYWAILDPIKYPRRMSPGKATLLISLVWVCSAAISFPAILWWRAVSDVSAPIHTCFFTEDTGYLVFSSIVSFYVPMIIIVFAYYRIYKAASEQMRSLKTGSKVMCNISRGGQKMTLRIHRGGGIRESTMNAVTYTRAPTSDSDNDSPVHQRMGADRNSTFENNNLHPGTIEHLGTEPNGTDDTPTRVSRTWRNFAISRKLSKIAKEQKAAKTLGIVIGVFCVCWVPFFVTNALYGICKTKCVLHAEVVFPVFNWLGYINSGMNPIIYACSMRDFRRSFSRILCCCAPRRLKRVSKARYQMSFSNNTTATAFPESIMTTTFRNGDAI